MSHPMTEKTPAATKAPDWTELRSRFPVLERRTYLNSCSYGALATSVREAFMHYLDTRDTKGCDWDWWVMQNESVRGAMAEFLGVSADEIAITTSASAGINSLASALRFDGRRSKVVISDFEFPTDGQIWYAQEPRGAHVVRVTAEDGYIPAERFAEAVDEQTLIVAVTHLCFRNGAKLDVEAIARIAKKNGAMILVDGYQTLGSLAFDARAAGVDFVVGGNLKYLLGTAGIGFMYARAPLIRSLVPTVTGWFAQEDIGAMDHTRNRPSPTARRFETGTPPVPATYAAEAGVRILQEVGMANVEARIGRLTKQIIARAQEAGYRLATPLAPERRGAMVNIVCEDADAMVARLDEADIVASCRDGALRLSPHFYNDDDDIARLFELLAEHEALITRE